MLNSKTITVFVCLIYSIALTACGSTGETKTDSTMSALSKGDTVPSFTLKDQNGNDFSVSDVIGKQNLVIYFYPKDDTPGCTKEACKFRDEFEDFKDANALVIGISADSPKSHKKFAEKYNLPFILLSDVGNVVRKKFGVPGSLFGLIPGRVTYIIDRDGVVQHVFNSQTRAEQHVAEAKKILEQMD